ncbi:zinc-ribbon domain-containing protein [Brachybacterium paraconglomeratum]|uniref:zinc-ribbon domain-containing protein n=1 Tax=Brachybacterium paraconglomeratum TaxID=173362 RepID=UPI00358DD564
MSTPPKSPRGEALSTAHPEIATQWHPTRNGELTPDQVSRGSHRRVWWACEQGHEWEAVINNRARGTGCPECALHRQRRPAAGRSLAAARPEVAAQWHPDKNGTLGPDGVSRSSDRRVWWKCEHGHEWEARVADRTAGRGCPACNRARRGRGRAAT